MNNAKLNVYKKVLEEVVEKFYGIEEFIKQKIKEFCGTEKLSVEEVTYCLWTITTTFKAEPSYVC